MSKFVNGLLSTSPSLFYKFQIRILLATAQEIILLSYGLNISDKNIRKIIISLNIGNNKKKLLAKVVQL